MRTWLHDFIDLIYPVVCEGCQSPLLQSEELLCASCVLSLPLEINHAVLKNKLPFENIETHTLLMFSKDGIVQDLIHSLKYRNKPEIGHYFGRLLAKKHLVIAEEIDGIVYVPMYAPKQKLRGYNQAKQVAEGLVSIWQKPILEEILFKNKGTSSQTTMTRQERYLNMTQTFEIKNADHLNGKTICLVDDVLTTGATIEAIISLLEKVGVKKTYILTVAAAL